MVFGRLLASEIDTATHLPLQARLVKWRGYWRGRTGLLRHDSCEFSNLKIHVYTHGRWVIPPWVTFNRLIAVEALKRHGHNSTNRPSHLLAQHSANPARALGPTRCQARFATAGAHHEVTDPQFDIGRERTEYRAPHDAGIRCVEHLPTDFQRLRRFGVRQLTCSRCRDRNNCGGWRLRRRGEFVWIC